MSARRLGVRNRQQACPKLFIESRSLHTKRRESTGTWPISEEKKVHSRDGINHLRFNVLTTSTDAQPVSSAPARVPGHDSVVTVVSTGGIVVVLSVKVVSVLLLATVVYWVNVGAGVHAIRRGSAQPAAVGGGANGKMWQGGSWWATTEEPGRFGASWHRTPRLFCARRGPPYHACASRIWLRRRWR
jgi:hypothetical protein